jgi:hypothetical protein
MPWPFKGKVPLREFTEVFLGTLNTNPTSQASAEQRLRTHVLPALGGYQLREITPTIVKRWQRDLETRVSKSYAHAIFVALGAVLPPAPKGVQVTRCHP